jgi:hypothetical protein
MPDEVEACLAALGNLTAANAPQQKECLKLAGGQNNFHNAVRAQVQRGGPWTLRCTRVPVLAPPDPATS